MKSRRSHLFLLVAMCVAGQLSTARAAEDTNAPAATTSAPTESGAPELMNSLLHLQARIHETQLAVERTRAEAELASARSAEAIAARLKQVEDSVNAARSQDMERFEKSFEAMRDSNRRLANLAGVFAVAGFLALGLTAWFQWRTVSRLSQIAASTASPPLALPPPQWLAALGSGLPANPNNPAALSSTRLMEALDRLEKRISEFEHDRVGNGEPRSAAAGVSPGNGAPAESEGATPEIVPDEFAAWLKEGDELLVRDQAKEAIACFDRILARNPRHAEALVRKGTACERLQDNPAALRCYDAAIAADPQFTVAYLYKGGLFNRLERFSEATECYEQALRVQESRPPA